jgi:aminoglycoside 3-N-acetyltransferase I
VHRPTRYEIRRLGIDDIDLMLSMLDCFGEAFDDRDTYCSAQPDSRYLRDLLGGECFVAVAAIAGGRVIGGLAGYELRKFEQARSEFYIYDLAVRREHRRKGAATALIAEFARIAKSRGAWVVFVQADLQDAPAISLYTKLGSPENVIHFDIALDRAVVGSSAHGSRGPAGVRPNIGSPR